MLELRSILGSSLMTDVTKQPTPQADTHAQDSSVHCEKPAQATPTPCPQANTEVLEKPGRRTFSAEYKQRILNEADACCEPGCIGQLLRREGLYSSHLSRVFIMARPTLSLINATRCCKLIDIYRCGVLESMQTRREFLENASHHNRRIVQPAFINHLARGLASGGGFMLLPNWALYADWTLEQLRAAADRFENLSPSGDFVLRPEDRPVTRFERRGARLGQPVRDLLFRRR
jgi:hypothetical protein